MMIEFVIRGYTGVLSLSCTQSFDASLLKKPIFQSLGLIARLDERFHVKHIF